MSSAPVTTSGNGTATTHPTGVTGNLTVIVTPSATTAVAPSKGAPPGHNISSATRVGIGISLGFAVVVIILTFWHLLSEARLRRQQNRAASQCNFASDEPLEQGGDSSLRAGSAESTRRRYEVIEARSSQLSPTSREPEPKSDPKRQDYMSVPPFGDAISPEEERGRPRGRMGRD